MRYLVPKIDNYKDTSSLTRGYYMSEKLDGIRVLWDGGISRGDKKANVPWSNTLKDARYRSTQMATGLWTKYGHPIFAPNWFLDMMPNAVMEGELFAGRGNWQTLSSIVKGQTPIDADWKLVKFISFDIPNVCELFAAGKVRFQAGYDKMVANALTYFTKRKRDDLSYIASDYPYETRRILRDRWWGTTIDETLIFSRNKAEPFFEEVLALGGEGVVFKSRDNVWRPTLNKDAMKWKPYTEAEAEVIGFTDGKGKYDGMTGALVCDFNGVTVELSGMTDDERQPGHFSLGDVVTFRYRELSDSGVPKEPRFIRIRAKSGEEDM